MQWLGEDSAALLAVVGAALVAGSIALVAAWSGNKNSRRQLAMQLMADKQQRERDRSMAVRRDVYIPAAEAISRIQSAISELADLGTDHALLSGRITADLGSLAKISVLGTDVTVFAISRLTAATMLAYLQLIAMRQKLLQRHGKLKAALAARDAAISQRQQITELLRQAFVSGNKDSTLLHRLHAQFEGDTRAAEARQADVERLLEEEVNEERELSMRILATNQEVLKHVPDALIAVRRELELPVDEPALRRIFAEQQTAALEVARHLLEHTGAGGQTAQAGAARDLGAREPEGRAVPAEGPGLILPGDGAGISVSQDLH